MVLVAITGATLALATAFANRSIEFEVPAYEAVRPVEPELEFQDPF